MTRLNLRIPDELAENLRRRAKSAGMPVSRFVVHLLTAGQWPPGYFEKTCGFLTEEMAIPADLPPEPVDSRN